MFNVKFLKILLLATLLVISVVYTIYPKIYIHVNIPLERYDQENFIELYNSSIDYLIETPGCTIPNYTKTMKFKEPQNFKKTCGVRAVFIKKINNNLIMFTIDENKMKHYTNKEYSCCYQFATAAIILGKEDYTALRYSRCEVFENGTETLLKEEVITVTCSINSAKNTVIYTDAYAIINKNNNTNLKRDKKSWNILLLGMDTMSRGRAYSSMPKTTDYMLKHNWLDYRGYQKVGYNTFPNVMSLLTGKNMSTIYKACSSGMDKCNEMMIWSEFQKAGYVTATGEDYLRLPDTFAKYGYKSPPTDHYLRPLFLTGEQFLGNIICTKKMPSAIHILDYTTTFTETYKENNFFGMFWLNSYSHNLENLPQLIDNEIVNFFDSLNDSGVLNNTFIFFTSDHGIRYGEMRIPYESYYEERLPMLFIWVPYNFRKIYKNEYRNMKINQNRLVTPYDLHITLWDVVIKSRILVKKISSDACPKCVSIFNEITPYRSCTDANVSEKWCTCHVMNGIDQKDIDVHNSIQLAVTNLQNRMKNIKTTPCKKCILLNLKKVHRIHTYRDESVNSTYFVLALVMTPGDVGYEVTLVKRNGKLSVIEPTHTISLYNTRGNCVIGQNDRSYCVCEKVAKCKIKH